MTRRKVNLAYIADDSTRKSCFKKRKKGLMKKANELSTLCGVDVCAIVISPYDQEAQAWPPPLEASDVIEKFRKMPQWDQGKKMANQESFTKARIKKLEDKLKKMEKENWRKETTNAMYKCLAGEEQLEAYNFYDLNDLEFVLNENIKSIERRITSLKKDPPQEQNLPPELVMIPAPTPEANMLPFQGVLDPSQGAMFPTQDTVVPPQAAMFPQGEMVHSHSTMLSPQGMTFPPQGMVGSPQGTPFPHQSSTLPTQGRVMLDGMSSGGGLEAAMMFDGLNIGGSSQVAWKDAGESSMNVQNQQRNPNDNQQWSTSVQNQPWSMDFQHSDLLPGFDWGNASSSNDAPSPSFTFPWE